MAVGYGLRGPKKKKKQGVDVITGTPSRPTVASRVPYGGESQVVGARPTYSMYDSPEKKRLQDILSMAKSTASAATRMTRGFGRMAARKALPSMVNLAGRAIETYGAGQRTGEVTRAGIGRDLLGADQALGELTLAEQAEAKKGPTTLKDIAAGKGLATKQWNPETGKYETISYGVRPERESRYGFGFGGAADKEYRQWYNMKEGRGMKSIFLNDPSAQAELAKWDAAETEEERDKIMAGLNLKMGPEQKIALEEYMDREMAAAGPAFHQEYRKRKEYERGLGTYDPAGLR